MTSQTRSKLAKTNASVERAYGVRQKSYGSHEAYQSDIEGQEHALNPGTNDLTTGTDENVQTHGILLSDGSDETTLPALGDESTTNGPLVVSQCLFCNSNSPTLELNLEHMYKQHGLFIPNQEYLYDIESLLGYMHKVISDFHACIYCDTTKATVGGIQQHMINKGHCMINLNKDSEFEEFYDYPTSGSETESAKATIGDDGDSGSDRQTQGSSTNPEHELSLCLSSGKTLAHRSQPRSYRQHLPTPAEHTEGASKRKAITDPSSTGENTNSRIGGGDRQIATRANNNTGMIGVPEHQQRALRAVEKKMLKLEVRARNDYQWGVQRSANRQKTYRVSDLDGRFRVKDPR